MSSSSREVPHVNTSAQWMGTETALIPFLTLINRGWSLPIPAPVSPLCNICTFPSCVITAVLIVPEMMKALEQPLHTKGGSTPCPSPLGLI